MATYDDFQAQQARLIDGVIELGIANVGELQTYGLETDFQALVNENLRVVGGFAYTKATIESFEGADCWTGQAAGQGCIDGSQDLSGKALNNSPDLKMTLSAEYNKSLESMPFDAFVNVSYQYQDDVNFSLLADPGAVQKAYSIVNLSAGIVESENGTLPSNCVCEQRFCTKTTSRVLVTRAACGRHSRLCAGCSA